VVGSLAGLVFAVVVIGSNHSCHFDAIVSPRRCTAAFPSSACAPASSDKQTTQSRCPPQGNRMNRFEESLLPTDPDKRVFFGSKTGESGRFGPKKGPNRRLLFPIS
jgi:hypothetical protein